MFRRSGKNAPPPIRRKQDKEEEQEKVQKKRGKDNSFSTSSLVRVIETCGQHIFQFLAPHDRVLLRQTSKLFYYNLLTLEVWHGLIGAIRVIEQKSQAKNKKTQIAALTNIGEDEEEEEERVEQAMVEVERIRMRQFDALDGSDESDSEEEEKQEQSKGKKQPQKRVEKLPTKDLQKPNPKENTLKPPAAKPSNVSVIVNPASGITSNVQPSPSPLPSSSRTLKGTMNVASSLSFPRAAAAVTPKVAKQSAATTTATSLLAAQSSVECEQSYPFEETPTIGRKQNGKFVIVQRRSSLLLRQSNGQTPTNTSQVMNSRSEMSTVASQTMRDFGSSSNTKNIFSRVDKSSNGLMVDPLQRTSNSFFKRNFFEKLNSYSDCDRGQQQRDSQQQLQQWLKVPECLRGQTYASLFDVKKAFSVNQKNLVQLESMMDTWIVECRQLEKAVDLQSIQVNTLGDEVTAWSEVTRVLALFKAETECEEVTRLLEVVQEKSANEESLKKKLVSFKGMKKKILMDRLSKASFAKVFSETSGELFNSLPNAELQRDFPTIWTSAVEIVSQLYEKFMSVFDLRIHAVAEKLYKVVTSKMAQCAVSVSLAADVHMPAVTQLLQSFQKLIQMLSEAWQKISELSCRKESSTKIHEKMFSRYIKHSVKVLGDLQKIHEALTKVNKKATSKKCEPSVRTPASAMIQKYAQHISDFDIFDLSSKRAWEAFMNEFQADFQYVKERVAAAAAQKEDISSKKQLAANKEEEGEGEEEEETASSSSNVFNPMFQTQVSWKVD